MASVLLINDELEEYGTKETIQNFLFEYFPDLGKQIEIKGGKQKIWTMDDIERILFRITKSCLAIVISEKVGIEIVAQTVALGITNFKPVVILGNRVVVQTLWKAPKGMLLLRESLTGNPYLDVPADNLRFRFQRTTNLISEQIEAGRIITVRDLFNLGARGIRGIYGMGETTTDDVIDTIKRQLSIDLRKM